VAYGSSVLSVSVMTLRQFQREARKQDEMKDTQHLESAHAKHKVLRKQLKEPEKEKNLLPVR